MFLPILLGIRAEASCGCNSDLQEMQKTLIKTFFDDINPRYIDRLQQDSDNITDSQSRLRIDFSNGKVNLIQVKLVNEGDFRIAFAPSSCEWLGITQCHQHFAVQTRMLPSKCVVFDVSVNKIFGTVDMCTLPAPMTTFCVRNNDIVGPIVLKGLPERMSAINISNTKIKQSVIYFDTLPKTLYDVRLHGLRVRGVRPLYPGDSVHDTRIFRGVYAG